jgi:hypothetical protein
VIIDKDFINDAFAREGGYKRFDNDMEGELATLLNALKKDYGQTLAITSLTEGPKGR